MAETYYQIPEVPAYDPKIRSLQNSDPANAETTFNPLFQRLIENIAAVKNLVPGENLLLNWDFRHPVNRQGKTEYVGSKTYTIDNWYLEYGITAIYPGYIELKPDPQLQGFGFCQILKGSEQYAGKTMTLSVLTDNGLTYGTLVAPNEDADRQFSLILDENNSMMLNWFSGVIRFFGGSSKIIAVKLELGSQQTLARQNDNGEWEIIDPPDYDLQYALCSLYSPITGQRVGSQHSNSNLLDNWYFVDPINQRGKTEGFAAGEYTIDRWYSRSEIEISPTFTENGLLLAEPGSGIGHVFEDSVFDAVVNKQVTLSFLTSSGELGAITQIVDPNNTMETILASTTSYVASVYRWSGSAYGRLQVLLYHNSNKETTNTDTIVAVKLELGPVQTLAHQDADGNWVLNDPPPNKALELVKCQSYLRKISFMEVISARFGDTVMASLPLIPPMRANPTILNPQIFKIYDNSGNYLDGTINNYYTGCTDNRLSVGLIIPQGNDVYTYGVTIRSGPESYFVFVSSEL